MRRLEATALLLYIAVKQAVGAPQQQEGKSTTRRWTQQQEGWVFRVREPRATLSVVRC